MLPLLAALAAAYVVGRSQGAKAPASRQPPPSRQRPETGRAEEVFGEALTFSLKGRQAMVGDVTAAVQVFTDPARRVVEGRLRRASLAKLDVTDVPDAHFFRLVPLGEKSALEAIEAAEVQGAHIFCSLSATLDEAQAGDYLRIVAWADSPRPSFWRSREFARLRTPVLVPEVAPVKVAVPVPASPAEVAGVVKEVDAEVPAAAPPKKAAAARVAKAAAATAAPTNGVHKPEPAEEPRPDSPAARGD